MMVDRVRSKCEEDRIFAPKQNERDCPMTKGFNLKVYI